MKIISDLLRRYRKLNTLTQSNLIDELINFSEFFSALNIVTLSRWENERTIPGLKKKQLLLKFLYSKNCFKDNTCRVRIKERYTHLQETLEQIFDIHFKHLIGNFPDADTYQYNIHTLKAYQDKQSYFEHIIRFEKGSNPKTVPYTITAATLEAWCDHPATFAIVCEANGQHAGHYILIKLKNSVADDILYRRRTIYELGLDDFCDTQKNGTYLSLTLFARSAKVAALLNIQHYLHLIDHMSTVDKIALSGIREDIVTMTKEYGVQLVARGEDKKNNYRWYSLSAPLEDILFSDTLVEAIY